MNRKLSILLLILFVSISCSTEKAKEKEDWEIAETHNTLQGYEHFLKLHPKSDFADKASLKIEEFHFKKAESVGSIKSYEDFLENFPKGYFNKIALERIEELNFIKAEYENTVLGYETFMKKYHQGDKAEKAKSRIEELYKERHPAFENAKTVRVVLNEDYGMLENIRLPFADDANQYLKNAGLEVVDTDFERGHIILNIEVKGEATKSKYWSWLSNGKGRTWGGQTVFRYDAASMTGIISLKIPNESAYKKSFKGQDTSSSSDSPEGVLFQAYNKVGSFRYKIAEIIGEIFGPNTLINHLRKYPIAKFDISRYTSECELFALDKLGWTPKDEISKIIYLLAKNQFDMYIKRGKPDVEPLIDVLKLSKSTIRERAAEALGKIGDPRAVDPLLDALRDSGPFSYVMKDVLMEITGKSFVTYEEWKKWWEENKEKFLKKK